MIYVICISINNMNNISLYLCIYLSIRLSFCLSISLFVYLSIYLLINQYIYLSYLTLPYLILSNLILSYLILPIYLSIYLSIYIYIYLSILFPCYINTYQTHHNMFPRHSIGLLMMCVYLYQSNCIYIYLSLNMKFLTVHHRLHQHVALLDPSRARGLGPEGPQPR